MKFAVIAAAGAVLCGMAAQAEDPIVLKDQKDKASYSIGLNIGGNLKQQALDLSPALVAAGVRDALSGGKPLLTDAEVAAVLMEFKKQMAGQQSAKGEKNKKDGEVFLSANGKKEGVKTLASGMQYKVLKEGKGKKPKASDTVTTHYRGTLIDGTEFDSSYKNGEPVSFPLTDVIPGWTEALQLMAVGSKWQLFIPSGLAYGEGGQGPIPPNSTLVFDIELIGIGGGEDPKK